MLQANGNVQKVLVNREISYISQIVYPQFRQTLLYERDIPSVHIEIKRDGTSY